MLMATPRRHHPYAGVGRHMMQVPQHHPSMMMAPSPQPQQLGQLPPPQVQGTTTTYGQQLSPMYGGQPTIDCHSPPVSRTYQYKKVTKPLLERKRRARINRCLDELKELMVGALEAEGENVSKLEKADILELTVRHLQRITRPRDAMEDASRFQAGFTQCATEACHFLLSLPGLDAHVGTRLVAHLTQMVNGMSTAAAASASSASSASPSTSPTPCPPSTPQAARHDALPARVSPPVSPTSTSSLPPTSRSADSTSRNFAATSKDAGDVDVESTEDEEDEESPVNYTSAALQRRERENACYSTSRRCQDDDRGPMWRPW